MEPQKRLELAQIRARQEELERQLGLLRKRLEALEQLEESPEVSEASSTEGMEEAWGAGSYLEKEIPPLPVIEDPLVPPPLPTPKPPPAAEAEASGGGEKESFELRFGRVWLVRVGVLIFLTGVVLLGNYAYQEFLGKLGAAGRLAMVFVCAGALGIAGRLFMKREGYQNFGRVLFGAGLAGGYYGVYAAHFVEALQIIPSPLLAGLALLGYAGLVFWLADRIRSQTVAAVMLALAFYSSAINPLEVFTLYGNLLLAGASVVLFLRHGWMLLHLLAAVGAYVGLVLWQVRPLFLEGFFLERGVATNVPVALGISALFWLLFTVGTLLRPALTSANPQRVVLAFLNNAGFLIATGLAFHSVRGGELWMLVLGFGVLLVGLGIGVFASKKYLPQLSGSLLAQGLFLIPVGLGLRAVDFGFAIAMALLTVLLVGSGRLAFPRLLVGFAVVFSFLGAVVACFFATGGFAAGTRFFVAGLLLFSVFLAHAKLWKAPVETRVGAGLLLISFFGAATFWVAAFHLLDFPAWVWVVLLGGVGLTFLAQSPQVWEWFWSGQAVVWGTGFFWLVSPEYRSDLLFAAPLAAVGLGLILLPAKFFPDAGGMAVRAVHGFFVVVTVWLWSMAALSQVWAGVVVSVLGLLALLGAYAGKQTVLHWCSLVLGFLALLTVFHPAFDGQEALPVFLATGVLLALGAGDFALKKVRAWAAAEKVALGFVALRVFACVPLFFAIKNFVPGDWVVLGLVLATWAGMNRWVFKPFPEFLACGAVFLAAATLGYLINFFHGVGEFWPDLFAGLAAIFVSLSMPRWTEPGWQSAARPSVALLGWLAIWASLSTLHSQTGIPLTLLWSALAVLAMVSGFVVREKFYRWFGLAVLLLAVVRVFLIDLSVLDPVWRIASFLGLGLVLVGLGFLYHRFSSRLKGWF